MLKSYHKPELTSYERPNLGYYSASNSNSTCQVDCASNTCTLVATASAAPCDNCDFPANTCGLGLLISDCL